MNRLLSRYCQILEVVSVVLLALMVALVFANVALRYLFNSGITVTEELSRWMFVWTTFLGGIVALRHHGHLGTEFLVGRLGPKGRKACLAVGYLLMLFVCWLLFRGALDQTILNWNVSAPSSGASLAWFYAAGVVFAVSAAAILGGELLRLLTGRLRDEDLVIVRESEDHA
ncbi:MAG: TRAP transporter small permease [Ferrovibrionaceae bacterium]